MLGRGCVRTLVGRIHGFSAVALVWCCWVGARLLCPTCLRDLHLAKIELASLSVLGWRYSHETITAIRFSLCVLNTKHTVRPTNQKRRNDAAGECDFRRPHPGMSTVVSRAGKLSIAKHRISEFAKTHETALSLSTRQDVSQMYPSSAAAKFRTGYPRVPEISWMYPIKCVSEFYARGPLNMTPFQ